MKLMYFRIRNTQRFVDLKPVTEIINKWKILIINKKIFLLIRKFKA